MMVASSVETKFRRCRNSDTDPTGFHGDGFFCSIKFDGRRVLYSTICCASQQAAINWLDGGHPQLLMMSVMT